MSQPNHRGAQFRFVYFKPSSGMNPEHQQIYGQNRFSVVRQVKFSKRSEEPLLMAAEEKARYGSK